MNTIRKKVVLVVVWAITVPVFVLSQVSFWAVPAYATDSISQLEDQIKKEEAAKAKLVQQDGQIQGAIYSTQTVINKTQAVIKETEQTISRKEAEISNLNDKIELQGEMLKNFLQQIYYIKSQPIIGVVLAEGNFTDILSNADHLMTLEDKIADASHELGNTKNQVEQDKIELAQAKQKHEEILDQKVDQKQDLLVDHANTQLSIADKQKTIDRLNKELRELQSDIDAVSGRSYSIEEIVNAAKYANKKTNVPVGFLIGVLKNETSLGKNMGQCTYDEVQAASMNNYNKLLKVSKNWQVYIDKLDERMNIFEDIVGVLGYSKKEKVSCTPKCILKISGKRGWCDNNGDGREDGYIGQGGAMGAAQFMSDVWQGYGSDITKMTGHKNPNPWDIDDAVMAMALKLGKTSGVTAGRESAMRSAACGYLGTCYKPYIDGVIYWTDHYKELL